MKPLILTAASVGNKWQKKDTPYIPQNPREIIADGLAAVKAGAGMLHIHSRTNEGEATLDPMYFVPLLETFRKECPDVVLQMSVGGMEGKTEELLEPLLALRPDMASFNLKSTREETLYMVKLFKKYNVVPIFECFSLEMVAKAKELLAEGLTQSPLRMEVIFELEDEGRSFPEMAGDLLAYHKAIPEGSFWSQTRGGSHHRKLQTMAAALGGNIRTGLEDSIYLEEGRFAKSSAELIQKATEAALLMGRTIATPAQARALLGLK